MSTEDTLERKLVIEQYTRRNGVTIYVYKAINETYQACKCAYAYKINARGIMFVGGNAHHQNGHAERRICELQKLC